MRRLLIQTMLTFLVMPLAVSAGEPQTLRTNWDGFQLEVTHRKLLKRTARVSLSSGDVVKAFVVKVSGEGLVIRPDPKTEQWTSIRDDGTTIPRELVSRVSFGKVGHRGLIGFLIGFGAGSGATALAAQGCEHRDCALAMMVIPVGAVAGYFVGHAASPSAPLFVIEH